MPLLNTHIQLQLDNFMLESDDALELKGITAVFGPSGAGKTTFLRILAGLEKNASGSLSYADEVWQNTQKNIFLPPHKRRIGFVFQDGRLFTHLTVEKNLYYSYKRAKKSLHKRNHIDFSKIVESLELRTLLSRFPDSLSGGEKQRVAIGRALLQNPQLLLMDEPLSALDRARKVEIIPYIEHTTKHFQIPILYVTHNIEEVARLANEIILISSGRIKATGTTENILERVDLRHLTDQLDEGAILQVTVDSTSEGITNLLIGKETLKVPAINLKPKTKVQLLIRAKEVAIATQPPHHLSIRNILNANILNIDISDKVFAELTLNVSGQSLRSRVTLNAVKELGLKKDQHVYALIKSVIFEGRILS
ncbi:MAG: molybdenum ABC transporter ATP-binding protein [Rhodospirillaceae bacterium]|nr:molybdenum ABC transporter ATP-binding protein [Rhodospirillaceae bacterium]